MTDAEDRSDGKGGFFPTTHWTAILAAADSRHPDCRATLAEFCREYWYPIYAEIRHGGHDADAARDLTQGFFVHVLEKGSLKLADPDRGRFRSFLKSSVRNFVAKEFHREQALKRGGGLPPVDLDLAESRYAADAARCSTPERAFETRWARQLLTRTLENLRAEFRGSETAERYRRVEPFLTGQHGTSHYRDVARELAMSESAVRVMVHRLRKRFGQLLRAEVAVTVGRPEDVDEELHFLFSVINT